MAENKSAAWGGGAEEKQSDSENNTSGETKRKKFFAPLPTRYLNDKSFCLLSRALGAIAAHDRMARNGQGCWASAKTLAKILDCHEKRLSVALRQLRELGYITKTKNEKNKRFNVYHLEYLEDDEITLRCGTRSTQEIGSVSSNLSEQATGSVGGNLSERLVSSRNGPALGNPESEQVAQAATCSGLIGSVNGPDRLRAPPPSSFKVKDFFFQKRERKRSSRSY